MDLRASLPLDYSWSHGQHGSDVGDFSIGLGFQILEQSPHTWLPDLRIFLQETIPTGRFEQLNSSKLGTDQTGIGSYQTSIGFNFQKSFTLNAAHYLRQSGNL